MPLPTNITAGDPNHSGRHNDTNAAVNALEGRTGAVEQRTGALEGRADSLEGRVNALDQNLTQITADLNTATVPGNYWFLPTLPNAPQINVGTTMILEVFDLNGVVTMQRATEVTGDTTYVRQIQGGSWTSWLKPNVKDSGWRSIAGLLQNGWTVAASDTGAFIRRVGTRVEMRLYRLVASANTDMLILPTGFTVSGPGVPGSPGRVDGTNAVAWIYPVANGHVYFEAPAGALVGVAVGWFTDDPFPNTLPGTPV